MEKYTLIRDDSTMNQSSMKLREEKSGKIIAEIRIEDYDFKIAVIFLVILIPVSQYLRNNYGEVFILSTPMVVIIIIGGIIWQFFNRGWDMYLHDPIISRIAHSGKIIKRGGDYTIMDKGRKRQYKLNIKTSWKAPNPEESVFTLSKTTPDVEIYELKASKGNITCMDLNGEVFSAKYVEEVMFIEGKKKKADFKTSLQVQNSTNRLFAFAVSTLIIFRFQRVILNIEHEIGTIGGAS